MARCGPCSPPARAPKCCRRCGGATSSAPSSSGWAPGRRRLDALGILEAAADGRIELLVLLGADPIADCPDADLARRAIAGARRVIAVDTFLTESSRQADVVLAAAAFGEKSGTTTNLEGRVTTIAQKVTAHGTARPDWMIAAQLAERLGHDVAVELGSLDDHRRHRRPYRRTPASRRSRSPRSATVSSPSRDARPCCRRGDPAPGRNSYDYRLVVSRKLYDRAVGTARCRRRWRRWAGAAAHIHPLDLAAPRRRRGTEVQVTGRRGTVVLPVVADPAVPRGSLRVPFNLPGASIADIIDAARRVHRRAGGAHVMADRCSRSTRCSIGDLSWTPLLIVLDQGRRRSSSSASSARCSWSGSSARSSPACRTGSGRTRPARSGCCRPSPTASSCSSRRTSCPTGRTGACSGWRRTSPSCRRSSCGR